MDEQLLAKLIKETIGEELKAIRQEMATKEDLKSFATKEDLEKLRAEMATKEDLKAFATKEDFLEFESRLSSTIEKIREGVRLYIFELEQEVRDIKSKLRFYDFDYIARQNDTMIKILKALYEEKTIISGRLKEHESRIEALEVMREGK